MSDNQKQQHTSTHNMSESDLYAFFNPCGNAYYSLSKKNVVTSVNTSKIEHPTPTNIDRQQLAALSDNDIFLATLMCPR